MHAVEIYLEAFLAACTGLPTNGTNAIRQRIYDFPDQPNYRAINIRLGTQEGTRIMGRMQRVLNVIVELWARGTVDELETLMTTMDLESYNAIVNSTAIRNVPTFEQVYFLSAQEPITSNEGKQPAIRMDVTYQVALTHSLTDAASP